MKKIFVAGLGNFGRSFAERAAWLGAFVTAVDTDAEKVATVKNTVAEALVLNCTDEETLKEKLSAGNYDTAVIGFHEDYSQVLLAAIYLREAGIPTIIGRAETQMHRDVLAKLGVTKIVLPEMDTGVRTAEQLILNTTEELTVTADEGIVHIPVPAGLVGKRLSKILMNRYKVRVIFVRREYIEQKYSRLIEPSEDPELTQHDYLILIGNLRKIAKFLEENV